MIWVLSTTRDPDAGLRCGGALRYAHCKVSLRSWIDGRHIQGKPPSSVTKRTPRLDIYEARLDSKGDD